MKNSLLLAVFATSVLGISSTSAMGQELAQPLTIKDMAQHEYVFENILVRVIAENGSIGTPEKVINTIKELWELRGTCRVFRDILTPERILCVLQDAGVDVNVVDSVCWTALHGAVFRGDFKMVRMLLAAGVDVDAVDRNGNTALHFASVSKYTESLRALLAAGADVSIASDERGLTALHYAAAWGNIECLRVLLTTVDIADEQCLAALCEAIKCSQEETAQILVNHCVENEIEVPEDLIPKLCALGVITKGLIWRSIQ